MTTLRDEVEALIADLSAKSHAAMMDGRSIESVEKGAVCHQLRQILSRHPEPADSVVTDEEVIAARQTFERQLRELCDSYGVEVHYETTGRMGASRASVNGKWAAIREFVRTYVFQSNKRAMAQARECDKRHAGDSVVVPMDLLQKLMGYTLCYADNLRSIRNSGPQVDMRSAVTKAAAILTTKAAP